MCRDMSMIVMSDFSVRWSKATSSHSEIVREHRLCDTGLVNQARSEAPFVGVEIVPPKGRYDAPVEQWVFSVDAGYTHILPPWWDAVRAEEAARAALPQWIAECVVLPGQIRSTVYVGQRVCVYGGTIQCVDGGTIQKVYGGTIEKVYGGTIQHVYGGTIQTVYGGTIQCVCGGAVQHVCGHGTVILKKPLPDIHIEGQGVVLDRTGETVEMRTAAPVDVPEIPIKEKQEGL